MDYYAKYLKYKNKYLELKNQNNMLGGVISNVTLIIKKDEQILFVKSSRGKLMLPGGRIDAREIPWTAVKREWTEETGIRFPTRDIANINEDAFNYHGHTLIWHGNSTVPQAYYVFNKHGLLKPGETTNIVWKSYDYIMAHQEEFKDNVVNSLRDMHRSGLV